MIDYVDAVVRSYDKAVRWDAEQGYSAGPLTADRLLRFRVPTPGISWQISHQSTPHTFSSLALSNSEIIRGSAAYLYTDAVLKTPASRIIPMQDVSETYKHPSWQLKDTGHSGSVPNLFHRVSLPYSLYYGRMYYPLSDLEAMVIKNWQSSRMIARYLGSNSRGYSIFTLDYQRRTPRHFQEFCFSTNEFLVGYKHSHHLISKFSNSLYNNSTLSIGAEFWLGLVSLSPHCSTGIRYSTHASNTGRPLSLTLSFNPLFGHLSTTFSAKTTSNSTFCARYDMNVYSIDSNLTFGYEFWQKDRYEEIQLRAEHHPSILDKPNLHRNLFKSENDPKIIDDLNKTFKTSLERLDHERSTIETFYRYYNNSKFNSVLKMSTSLRDKNLRVLWEGHYRDLLIAAGTEFKFSNGNNKFTSADANPPQRTILMQPPRLGIQIQYST